MNSQEKVESDKKRVMVAVAGSEPEDSPAFIHALKYTTPKDRIFLVLSLFELSIDMLRCQP